MAQPSATPLDRLAPDQRAAVELVLRQDRSYGELAELLGIPEASVRARAHSGVEALAPDLAPPASAGDVADWLLGQQREADAARTRALLATDEAIRRWAETVAAPLRDLAPGRVPAVPAPALEDAELPPPRRNGKSRRARPLRDERAEDRAEVAARSGEGRADGTPARATGRAAAPSGASDGADAAAAGAAAAIGGPAEVAHEERGEPAAPHARSSRLGGAILIGAVVLVVAGILAFAFLRGGDDANNERAAAALPTASATPASPQPTGNDIVLRGPAGSQTVGLMRLLRDSDGKVNFAIVGGKVPANKRGEVYSIWFTKRDGAARRIGVLRDQVGKDGVLATGGPQPKDIDRFPTWFATYDTVLITRDGRALHPRKHGQVILSGDLPHATTR